MDYQIIVSPYQKNIVNTGLEFKQQDYGAALVISVDGYDTTDTTAKIVFRRSDAVIREYNISKQDDGTYKYVLSADETYSVGRVVVDLKFYKTGVRESTASFTFTVTPDKVGTTFASGTYSESIAQAVAQCTQAIDTMQSECNAAIAEVESALLAELNIYNGYDKTTSGYAADARQLNESVTGSYAEIVKNRIGALADLTTTAKGSTVAAINELKSANTTLNNNFDTLSDYQIIGLEASANTSFCTVAGAVIKYGKICIINGTLVTSAELIAGTTYTVMQNINTAVKSKVPIRINYTVDASGCGAKGSVESNNTVSLIPIMQNIPSGKYIEFFGVYICD